MTSAGPNIATCKSCGTLIDVSEQEPFALVNCSSCGAEMRVRKDFANFELQGVLGEGGQGIVYRAVDKKLSRQVAIKVMKSEYSSDPDFVKRFESEARITASLNNPHIVKVYSSGEYGGLLYLAMEVVDHGSLDSLITHSKKVSEEQALDIGIQIATGLKAGLELGLIHRDIKPGNILFADVHTAKIVDFGLAILVEKQHEEEGEVWATPFYVSPEKLEGRAEDFRSDMYSLAATLFHAIAGRPPFISESNSMAELRRIKSQPVRLLNFAPHVSTATAYAIDRALSFNPKDRFDSYTHFIENLEYARAELRKHPVKQRVPRVMMVGDRIQGGSWTIFATVAIVVGVGLYFWTKRPGTGPAKPGATTVAGESTGEDLTAEMRFDLGRKQLVEERFSEAAKTFRVLYEEGRLPEPKNSWAAVHCGLAEYLVGRTGPARSAFKKLSERTTPTAIGLDADLVAFFKQLSRLASNKADDEPPKFDEFDATTYESLILLIAGVKSWDEGNFEEAIALMRRFQMATPGGEDAWVADYRPLVARFLEDYGMYREIADDVAKADVSPKLADAALKKIPATKSRLRSTKLIDNLDEMEARHGDKVRKAISAADHAMKQQQADAEAREEKLLTDAKFKLKALCENYRFTEAAALIRAVQLKGERLVAERELLTKRVDWLVEFKRQLIEDLNTGGCTLALQRKSGQKISGAIAKASDHQVEVRVQFGSLPVSWNDISAQSVLQMSRTYMRPKLSQEALADRLWRAGVFCLFSQLFNEGQALMDDAATRKPAYQSDRALFFGEPAPNPAPELAPPPPGENPGSGLEMSEQPLNPSLKPKTSGFPSGSSPDSTE